MKTVEKHKNPFHASDLSSVTTLILAVILILSWVVHSAVTKNEQPTNITKTTDIRGIWIASAMNINFPSSPDLPADQLKEELDSIIDTAKSASLNAIFFQVRPSSDALYDSDIYPVSQYLSSNGKLYFDPLDYLIREAHKHGIAVHAWVNPLRVTASYSLDSNEAFSKLSSNCPAVQNKDLTVFYGDGKLYYDPGLPQVKKLVVDGITEIVKKYDVDGIIIDDYFYPYPVYSGDTGEYAIFDDADTYEQYGGEHDSVEDWRRANINGIVKAIYTAIKAVDKSCMFGVSPYGIWQNNDGKNGGSDTQGLEAYSEIFCDALSWIDGEYIDYIAPQIPWQLSDPCNPYDVLVDWWSEKTKDSSVMLVISHAPYRYEGEWKDPAGEITRQIHYAMSFPKYIGSVFYGYDSIKNNTGGVLDELRSLYGKCR